MINYYQLLGLDPEEFDPERDHAAIRTRIEEMRGEWSSGTAADPRQAEANRARLDSELIPDLVGIKKEWRQHRQLERERLKQEEVRAETKLGHFAQLLRTRGQATDDDAKRIARDLKAEFPTKPLERLLGGPCDKERVRQWLKRRGVMFTGQQPGQAPAPKAEQLDPAKAGPIFADLDFLVGQGKIDRADLYSLLAAETGLPVGPTNSTGELRAMSDELELEVRRTGRTDPVSSAKLSLYGQCRDVLGDEANKTRYDLTLALRVMKPFDTNLRLAASGGVLLPAAQEELVQQAAKAGVSADLARKWMELTTASWSPPVTLVKVPVHEGLPRCGYCHALASRPEDKTCPGCGRDLFVMCPNPNCGKLLPTTRRYCECRYAVGDAPLYAARLKEAEVAAAAGDTARARYLATAVLEAWPGYPRALRIIDRIQAEEITLGRVEADVLGLLADAKGHAARARLTASDAARLPRSAELLNRADRLIAAAAREVAEGQRLQAAGRADDAIDRFESALRACADYPEALAALAACPPAQPGELEVGMMGGTATLRWGTSAARGTVRYRVVRKSGSAPRSPGDGVAVGTVVGTALTDPDLPVGETVFYAVYAVRGDAYSLTATIAAPALRVADVTALRAVGRDGCVELAWVPHPKAEAIEVWRQAGRVPSRRGDGVQVPVAATGRATDLGLENGSFYGYRVVAAFRGPDGGLRYAEAAEVTATPVALPRQVTDLRARRLSDREVEAEWTPPADGAGVAVFASKTRPAHTAGSILSAADLSSLGSRLDAVSAGLARGRTEPVSVLHLTPVSVAGSTAVVGPAVKLSAVPDATNLRVRYAGGRLVCQWDWPAGVNSALVAWRADSPPSRPTDKLASRRQCSRFKYDQDGGFEFTAPEAERLHLAVFATAPSEDGPQYAPGGPGARCEIPLRACARVRYAVKQTRRVLGLLGGDRYTLTVTTDADTSLCELSLVVRGGEVPLDRDDGDVVHRVPAGTRCGPHSPYETPLDFTRLPRDPRFRLFPSDRDDGRWLDL